MRLFVCANPKFIVLEKAAWRVITKWFYSDSRAEASNFYNGGVVHGNRVSRDLRSLVSERKARNATQRKPLEASTFLQRVIIAVKYRYGVLETNYRPLTQASNGKKMKCALSRREPEIVCRSTHNGTKTGEREF